MKVIDVAIVSGAEGYSLQICNKSGGTRVAGPKAWGNAYNHPTAEFTLSADELIAAINNEAYDPTAEEVEG